MLPNDHYIEQSNRDYYLELICEGFGWGVIIFCFAMWMRK